MRTLFRRRYDARRREWTPWSYTEDTATLAAMRPYAVICATGGIPLKPRSIPGLDGEKVFTAPEIILGEKTLKDSRVAVIGSGMTGLETAEILCAQGNKVTMVEMAPELAPGTWFQLVDDVMSRIAPYGPEIRTGTKLVSVEDGKIITQDAKYLEHLKGREGQIVFTISAMGEMALPGYALYAASKFAMKGFQQAVRLEAPENLKMTCIYPVSTETNLFKVGGNGVEMEKPFPVQSPEAVAKAAARAIEKGKKSVYPCPIYLPSRVLMSVLPFVRSIYLKNEQCRLMRFLEFKKRMVCGCI